jgi:3-deoxy-D-manno-octulosonic-acid transferase
MADSSASPPWRWRIALVFYRILGPLLLLLALPAWLRKMAARGGWSTPFGERFSCYRDESEWAPLGTLHFHAVSVGETLIALKLLRAIRKTTASRMVLAVSTATAYDVAKSASIADLDVIYSPIDLHLFVHRYLARFQPQKIVLVEAEAWPELMQQCKKSGIPVQMINARLSARSEKRFASLRRWISPLFQHISAFAVQEECDLLRFTNIGIDSTRLHLCGSIKFDPAADAAPQLRPEFAARLESLSDGKPIVLIASSHAGEEVMLCSAIRDAGAFPLCVPRHAERRHEVFEALQACGFDTHLRSQTERSRNAGDACLVVDTTGELRDWTAHADAVIIGKSFLAIGGQNPAEAIIANKPLLFGPHMENFEPLVSRLLEKNAAIRVTDAHKLSAALRSLLVDSDQQQVMTHAAAIVLAQHAGATERTIQILDLLKSPSSNTQKDRTKVERY